MRRSAENPKILNQSERSAMTLKKFRLRKSRLILFQSSYLESLDDVIVYKAIFG